MVIIIMGVSGSGKTRIGKLLASDLGWPFYDGDDYHSQVNIDKMRKGIALTDEDRISWLNALRALIGKLIEKRSDGIIACSALKKTYRDLLSRGDDAVVFVFLKGEYRLIYERLKARRDHFFNNALLASQFEALEEPVDALLVDIDDEPGAIVGTIKKALDL